MLFEKLELAHLVMETRKVLVYNLADIFLCLCLFVVVVVVVVVAVPAVAFVVFGRKIIVKLFGRFYCSFQPH